MAHGPDTQRWRTLVLVYPVMNARIGSGITSAVAAADSDYVLAVADNALLTAPFGTAQGGPLFDGVNTLFTHRNSIAHRGETPNLAEARADLAAAVKLFAWLDSLPDPKNECEVT